MTEILYPLTKTVGGFAAPAVGVPARFALPPVPGVLPARRQVPSQLMSS